MLDGLGDFFSELPGVRMIENVLEGESLETIVGDAFCDVQALASNPLLQGAANIALPGSGVAMKAAGMLGGSLKL